MLQVLLDHHPLVVGRLPGPAGRRWSARSGGHQGHDRRAWAKRTSGDLGLGEQFCCFYWETSLSQAERMVQLLCRIFIRSAVLVNIRLSETKRLKITPEQVRFLLRMNDNHRSIELADSNSPSNKKYVIETISLGTSD